MLPGVLLQSLDLKPRSPPLGFLSTSWCPEWDGVCPGRPCPLALHAYSSLRNVQGLPSKINILFWSLRIELFSVFSDLLGTCLGAKPTLDRSCLRFPTWAPPAWRARVSLRLRSLQWEPVWLCACPHCPLFPLWALCSLMSCLGLNTSSQLPPPACQALANLHAHACTHMHSHTLADTCVISIHSQTPPIYSHTHTTNTRTAHISLSNMHPQTHRSLTYMLKHTRKRTCPVCFPWHTQTHIYTHAHTPTDPPSQTCVGALLAAIRKELCSDVREEKFKWKSDPVIIGFSTRTFFFPQGWSWKWKRPRRWESFLGVGR